MADDSGRTLIVLGIPMLCVLVAAQDQPLDPITIDPRELAQTPVVEMDEPPPSPRVIVDTRGHQPRFVGAMSVAEPKWTAGGWKCETEIVTFGNPYPEDGLAAESIEDIEWLWEAEMSMPPHLRGRSAELSDAIRLSLESYLGGKSRRDALSSENEESVGEDDEN